VATPGGPQYSCVFMLVFMPELKIKARLARSRENAPEIPAGGWGPISSIKSRERRPALAKSHLHVVRVPTRRVEKGQTTSIRRNVRRRSRGPCKRVFNYRARIRVYIYIYIYIYILYIYVYIEFSRMQNSVRRKRNSRREVSFYHPTTTRPPASLASSPHPPALLSRREVLAGSARHSR